MLQYTLKKLLAGLPLILGVTFISFVLMVYFGPDKTYELAGKNPTEEQIAQIRADLGYDQPFFKRYTTYVIELATLNFGHSDSTGERVTRLLGRTIPISLALTLPGFVLGNVIGILLALLAAYYRSTWIDKSIMTFAVVGMSVSFLIIIIGFQVMFSSAYGLNMFPVRGWSMDTLGEYLYYVTVPTLAIVFVSLGYNTRFYRAVIVEELGKDHIRTARAYGASARSILLKRVLKNSMIPIITRIMFSIPLVVISGSLLIESYFGIPGVGKVTYDAITTGDQPVLKAVVGATAVLFVVVLIVTDVLYRLFDPRVELK
ncbi:oligopeptide ABC transporter permease [Oceanococcus atlanticus]|uniref:Oligopeptide ABC transporter permease n=1 Tax=Oceanococcus atlanticus TaxID=1317117 RepID=A0A1Y1S9V2_9GAMM|nr:ABC transporter permease [Oceanococcus atlanticus]ORE85050.1 oligopeptide ABC transporter permease [Oceanococcus atlanticus]RZO84498.1 MAG: ABC transporter permease [Oceanococcus sp.]